MLFIGIKDKTLQADEITWLEQPQVSGVILFARNYAEPQQLRQLVQQIRTVRAESDFVIGVDQEGGRVQRFIHGFTRLPPLASIGAWWDKDPAKAQQLAWQHAWLMAREIQACDIDISFAPVLDLGRGNQAIGNRALHADPAAVSALGKAYIDGMHAAGMAVTVKHFPGHGSVEADTHIAEAIDERDFEQIDANDLEPFRAAFKSGIEAVMMAHVIYPQVDAAAAGQSTQWIRYILREQMGFAGCVLSDDLSMVGAGGDGDIATRIDRHMQAGCDIALACQPEAVPAALAATRNATACSPARIRSLCGDVDKRGKSLQDDSQYALCKAQIHAVLA